MSGKHDPLLTKIHGPAESNAAGIPLAIRPLPSGGDGNNLFHHPCGAAFTVCAVRFTFQHAIAIENGHAEFGAANVDRECNHSPDAASTSAALAVPVPCFMMVMDATRFPTRAASVADPVIASATAAPAEKLSPAPQMSRGFSTARAGTSVSVFSSTTRTPCWP